MKKIKCMIVDDEPIARDIITKHINSTPELTLSRSCISPIEAYEGLLEHDIELLFLDINMPIISGIDFLRSLNNPPKVIFTTAYPNYALEGYELNSIDYLLKPITYERFIQSIQKVKQHLALNSWQSEDGLPQKNNYFFIKVANKLVKLHVNDILYIKADGDFTLFVLTTDSIFASIPLKEAEEQLNANTFVRIHRSFIVNLSKIDAVKGNIIEIGKEQIPIGPNYRAALLKKMDI